MGLAASSVQFPVPSFLSSPSLSLSHLSPLSKLEPGSLSLSHCAEDHYCIEDGAARAPGFCVYASPVFFVERIRCLGTTTVRMGDQLQKDHPPSKIIYNCRMHLRRAPLKALQVGNVYTLICHTRIIRIHRRTHLCITSAVMAVGL